MAMLDDNPEHNMANLEEDYKLFERKFLRPVDVKFIENTEKELSVKFPPNYRDKMKKDNGGELSSRHCEWWELFHFFDTTNRKTITKTCINIIRETKSAKKWYGLPENAIAIGTDRFGNYLFFLPKKDDPDVLEDVVYAWWPSMGKVNIEIKEIK